MTLLLPSRRLLLAPSIGKGLSRGLIGVWPLSNGGGADLSGQGNHLTPSASAPTSAVGPSGKILKATQFTALNSQRLTHTDSALLQMGTGVKMAGCIWAYLDSKPAEADLFDKRNPGNEYYLMYIGGVTDRFRFEVNGTTNVTANNLGAPSLATWYFIVFQYTGAVLRIRINGGTANTTAFTTDITPTAGGFEIGGIAGGFHDGRLAMGCLWKNRNLSVSEEDYLYNNGQGRLYAGSGGFV